ncbi:MAG: hypothetical protein FJ403_01640 [Verrucomicrobia bacterium]|nr:hypothetical protein [Verrucomicrobiota bacterium]
MNRISAMTIPGLRDARTFSSALGFAFLLVLGGCAKEEIRVYTTPKQTNAPSMAKAEADGPELPHANWNVPKGWIEKPASGMRVGSFSIRGPDGQEADVSIIPLGGRAGSELENINRWRGQIGLEPVPAEQLSALTQDVAVGEARGSLVDMAGTDAQTKKPTRVIGAILPTKEATWFFKMTGADALVAEQKPVFTEFLKSVHFDTAESHAHAHATAEPKTASASDAAPSGNASNEPIWEVPSGWTAQPPTSMLLARFAITGLQAAKAEVTVSSFPGDVGGLLANVNRWRGQLNLGPITESELGKLTSPIDLGGTKATLVELEPKEKGAGAKRLIVAVVPRNGSTWFFKLMGDDALVVQEKAALLKFVQSVRYPNA